MLVRSMPMPAGRICWAQTFGGGMRSGWTLAVRQQIPSRIWPLVERQDLLLRLQRVFVGEVVGREQHGQRVVDEVQLLQAQDRLAVGIEVVAVGIGDPVDRVARLSPRFRGR